MQIGPTETVLLLCAACLMLFDGVRDAIADRAVRAYDVVNDKAAAVRLPLGSRTEKVLVTLGALTFYIARVKNLRKYPLSDPANSEAFGVMAIGVLLGMFMDLDD